MQISLVLTTYNGTKYLKTQLDSIRLQTLQPDEVLIFDDLSTDDTAILIRDYINHYQLKHWTFKINRQNQGFKANFTQALFASSGDIVFLCDQDDYWHHDKVEQMVAIMKEKPFILTLASDFELINDSGDLLEIKDVRSNCGMLDFQADAGDLIQVNYQDLLMKNFAQGCTMAVRRQVIEALKYNLYPELEHDWSLALISSLKNGCYFYCKPLIQYRIHSTNTIGLASMTQSTEKRVNQRFAQVSLELYRVNFALQYAPSKYCYDLASREDYYVERLNVIEHRNIFKLIKVYFNSRYRSFSNLRSLLGDALAIIKI